MLIVLVFLIFSNQITIAGGEKLALYLEENMTLTQLDLAANRVDSTGGLALAKALQKNRTLTWYDEKNEILSLTLNAQY